MIRLVFAVFLLLPGALEAACIGVDVRPDLDAAQRAELDQRLADMPYPAGNHWTATKGGQTLRIVGTFHLDDPRLDPVAARLKPLIKQADRVMLEATDTEITALQKAVASRPELMFITSGPTLIDLLPPEEWDELAKAAAARGLPGFMVAKFQPWYLSIVLSTPPCMAAEMQNGPRGLDHRIMKMAQAEGIPTQALEAYDTLFTIFGQDPLEEQVEMLRLGLVPPDGAENAFETLKLQYFEEAHGAAVELSRIVSRPLIDLPPEEFDAEYDKLMGAILTQRNIAWMDRILAATDETVLIAVGAGHLSGEYGLLNLLAAEGYALNREAF